MSNRCTFSIQPGKTFALTESPRNCIFQVYFDLNQFNSIYKYGYKNTLLKHGRNT